jgi:hypothetical protein
MQNAKLKSSNEYIYVTLLRSRGSLHNHKFGALICSKQRMSSCNNGKTHSLMFIEEMQGMFEIRPKVSQSSLKHS